MSVLYASRYITFVLFYSSHVVHGCRSRHTNYMVLYGVILIFNFAKIISVLTILFECCVITRFGTYRGIHKIIICIRVHGILLS